MSEEKEVAKTLLRCSSCDRPFIGANIKTVAKPMCKECWIESLESRLKEANDEIARIKDSTMPWTRGFGDGHKSRDKEIQSLEQRLSQAEDKLKANGEYAESADNETFKLHRRLSQAEAERDKLKALNGTHKILYEARLEKYESLLKASEGLEKALEESREYFDERSDCDHNGINFVANEENKMLGVVDSALAEFRAVKEGKI